MRLSRVLAVALAAVICAGFAVGVRQSEDAGALAALLSTGHALTPVQQHSAASELSSAAFGYPGQDVHLLGAELALREHHYAHARSIAQSINRAEPDNLRGWVALAAAGLVIPDRRALAEAENQESRLNPIGARPR